MIIHNNIIRCISFYDHIVKISNYADDSVIITYGTNCSLTKVINILNAFSKGSGLNVNFEKCHRFAFELFYNSTLNYFSNFPFICTDEPITYLGISFTHHEEDSFRLNYLPEFSRIKTLLNTWASRDLTPMGKILVMKTFALSVSLFVCRFPNSQSTFLYELESLFHKFIGQTNLIK